MTLRKFAVDYSKIKNDGPKVAVPNTSAAYLVANVSDVQNQILDEIDQAAAALEGGLPVLGIDGSITNNFYSTYLMALSPKVAALRNIHAAVELIRKFKKEKSQAGSTVKTPAVNWFRGYYAHFGLRMRCNSTTKYYVELHLGPLGWQTWQMLLGLGYTPDQDEFWLELDGFICAQSVSTATLDNVDGDLFMGEV